MSSSRQARAALWLDKLLGEAPLVRALHHALRAKERGALALFALIGAYSLLALSTPFSTRMQQSQIAATHFRPRTLASWLVLQPLPKMYGHENRAFVAKTPLVGARLAPPARAGFEERAWWVNHYPARVGRFDGERASTFADDSVVRYVVVRTTYRDVTVYSRWVARIEGGRLVLAPEPVSP